MSSIRTVLYIVVLWLSLASIAGAQLLPPHATLPDANTCVKRLVPTAENRPDNVAYNNDTPTPSELAQFYVTPLQFTFGPPFSDFYKVDGNVHGGSTDELIQYYACKWGMDQDMLRAQAWAESGWNQTVQGDIQHDPKLCTGGNGFNSWQSNGNYCYTSFSLIQIKCTNYNACPAAQESVPFALDFRGSYWRSCMEGHVKYYSDSKPQPGYPPYPNGTPQQMAEGCLGSWYSGNWYDANALPYINRVKGYMQSKPWLPSFRFTSPTQNQTVSGTVKVSITWPNTPGQCFYACVNADTGFIGCVPGQGPWNWDTMGKVPNGPHLLMADAYTCNMSNPAGNDMPIGWPQARVMVNVSNGGKYH